MRRSRSSSPRPWYAGASATRVARVPGASGLGRGVHPDVEIITVAPDKTQITLEQALHVVENVSLLPYEGMRRVFIVDSCHTPPLGTDAASALLKTLEEPPSRVTFVLLASNPGRVLPTIASRTVQLRIPPPRIDELVPVLAAVQAPAPGACRRVAGRRQRGR